METEIITLPTERPDQGPLAMLAAMVEKGAAPEAIKAMSDLAKEWRAMAAEEAFAKALTAFQEECPPIHKARDVKNKEGHHRYSFSAFDDIMKIIRPLLTKHRIAVSFDTEQVEALMKVTCKVRVGSHAEQTTVTVAVPQANQLVNATQTFGQAVSYGKRYSMAAALNIVTTDEDTDCQTIDPLLTPEQVKVINELLIDCEGAAKPVNKPRLWAFLIGREPEANEEFGLHMVCQSAFVKAVDFLNRKRREAKK